MKRLIPLVSLLVVWSVGARAQVVRIADSYPVRDGTVAVLTTIDTLPMVEFSLGNAADMPTARLDSIVRAVAAAESDSVLRRIYIRGTADAVGWRGVTSEAENDRKNDSLATERARWAVGRMGRGQILPSRIRAARRGIDMYVAVYRVQSPPSLPVTVAAAESVFVYDSVFVFDTVHVYHTVEHTHLVTQPDSAKWRFGVGPGVGTLFTDGMQFWAPTLSFTAARERQLYVTLTGGYRWMGAVGPDPLSPSNPRPEFRDRAETIASLEVSWYPDDDPGDDWWGVAFGVRGAWETVRELDEFRERAYGVNLGPRARFLGRRVVLGIDAQFSNLSEFGVGGSRWRLGIAPSLSLNLFP